VFEIKEDLTVDNILSRIDEYNIFRAYCPNFKEIDKPFKSEYRDESIPSCRIIYKNKRLWYKDFGSGDKAVDCFGYIMKKYSMSFLQALGIVNLDFNLGLQQGTLIRPSLNLFGFTDKVVLTEKRDTEIQVKYRAWLKKDVEFWRDTFYIEKNTLELYQTSPIKYLFINGKFMVAPELSYASLIDVEDSKPIYKIYSPNNIYKWLTN